jgi:hypothetical protein
VEEGVRLDIEMRSSGPGPCKNVGVPTGANAYWRTTLLAECFEWMADQWPRDGVAVIIRVAW